MLAINDVDTYLYHQLSPIGIDFEIQLIMMPISKHGAVIMLLNADKGNVVFLEDSKSKLTQNNNICLKIVGIF